jgi:hypothetical protein
MINTARWPTIPDSCQTPIVFEDKNLGICMLAMLGGVQWILRVHDGHWCTLRPVGPNDPLFVEQLNPKTQRPEPSGKSPKGQKVKRGRPNEREKRGKSNA